VRRIGHKGADLIAPGNTAASFEAALAAEVDMIEFDVLSEYVDGSGGLYLAHDYGDLKRRRADVLTLADGLALFAGEAYAGIDLNVDLKLPGYEDRVVAALREAGLADRALISTMEKASLRHIRATDREIRLGWSVPRVKRNPFKSPLTALPAYGALQVIRRRLPRQVGRALSEGRVDAIMANFHVVTPELVRTVLLAGGEIYVWTVDDPRRIEELRRLGVTGCISNDPRLLLAERS
jgi:glycerophosphoryl diester phosphodiesterase